MGYLIERLRDYDGMTESQLRELYRNNRLRMAASLGISPEKYEICLRKEKDLEHLLKCIQIYQKDTWKLSDHFDHQRICPH